MNPHDMSWSKCNQPQRSHNFERHLSVVFYAAKPAKRTFRQRIAKRIELFAARLKNYDYYRSKGQGIAESWDKAGRTL